VRIRGESVNVRVLREVRPSASETRTTVTLAQSVLKGERMDEVVRDAVMLGVSVIAPLVTTRSEMSLASLARGHRRARWERVAVASAKQCGRALVPSVCDPVDFADFLEETARSGAGTVLMLVEPSAGVGVMLKDLSQASPRSAVVLVGPEGGWTPEELSAGGAAGCLVRLGARTLRADAVPIVALSALLTVWREL
jgi:16S rRNA (uracil1498-N3)-methyltransferase